MQTKRIFLDYKNDNLANREPPETTLQYLFQFNALKDRLSFSIKKIKHIVFLGLQDKIINIEGPDHKTIFSRKEGRVIFQNCFPLRGYTNELSQSSFSSGRRQDQKKF